MRECPGQGPTASTVEAAWKALGSVEAMSKPLPNTVAAFSKQNLFAKAVHAAFYGHHPLVLSPDVIWLTIAQGLANHVDQNAVRETSSAPPFPQFLSASFASRLS
eukprot:SAG11_NODE_2680_length_3104_cov_1.455241_2_plen_105_part_00